MLKSRQDDRIMLIRFDGAKMDGVYSTDDYIDGNRNSPSKVTEYILERVKINIMVNSDP